MGESDHDFYLASYEGTRERSVFNQRLYARKNDPGRVLVLAGHTLFIRTVRGLETSDLAPDQIRRVLREEMGISEALIEEWARSGGLAECFEEPSGPKSPPVIGQPPSQRDPAAATSSSGA
jgi:arylamine N-acetyltransferase